MSLEPWQQRVIEERSALSVRHVNLTDHIENRNAFSPITPDFILLVRQHTAMTVYLEILDERIARFNDATRT